MIRLATAFVAFLSTAAAGLAAVDIQEIESPRGIKAWLVEDHTIPFVALELRFRGGSSIEPEDWRGATYLMSGLLGEGAGELESAEFQKRLEKLAVEIEFDAYRETFAVSAKFLTENRSDSVEMLRLALQEPRFDEEPFERVRSQVLAVIAQNERDPDEIAGLEFSRIMFGGHPYGLQVEGTVDSVAALVREDMFEVHKHALTRDGVIVGAAGDISPEELGELLDNLLGGLPATGPEPVAAAEFPSFHNLEVIDHPSPQSVIVFGHPGFLRNDPDFLAAYVVNEILGGGEFLSRLRDEIREKRGLTYGIYSYLAAYKSAGLILGRFATVNESAGEAIGLVKDEWKRMSDEGITESELVDAKTFLTGAYALRFDGNAAIASILAGMQVSEMPASYVIERNDLVNALTLAEVNRVASRLMKPDELRFVVVGRPEGLTAEN